jgi:tetratricopeptide (TPR) repeat protein
LLEATILYRQGNYDGAWALTERIVTTPSKTSGQATNRAHFLRGLIAAERGETRQLRTEIAALGEPTDPRLQADHLELSGHLALAEGRWETAVSAFTEAAKLRSDTGDYRGTVRALAMAGDVSERAGRPSEAANQFLRAGRSAAIQGDNGEARELLTRANRLAEQAGDHETAQDARDHLTKLRDAEQARTTTAPDT